jgi:hypothetical protein
MDSTDSNKPAVGGVLGGVLQRFRQHPQPAPAPAAAEVVEDLSPPADVAHPAIVPIAPRPRSSLCGKAIGSAPQPCGPIENYIHESWDAERAAAVLVEVEGLIDAALAPGGVANTQARRNVMANERAIIRRHVETQNPCVWTWPDSLRNLLARWK